MTLQEELRHLLNKCCAENASNTPDFILAEYLVRCLDAFEKATNARDKWYGAELKPGMHLSWPRLTREEMHERSKAQDEGSKWPLSLTMLPVDHEHPVAVGITPKDLGWPKELPEDYPLRLCICGQCASKVKLSDLSKEALGYQFDYTMNWCGLCGHVKCRHNIHPGEPYHDILMNFFPNGF